MFANDFPMISQVVTTPLGFVTTALHRFAQNFDTLSDADALPMFLGSGTSEDG